jgi:hypothetical protein
MSMLEPTFDETLVKVFGEKAHAMSPDQKEMLKTLWDTAFSEGKQKQLELEVGGLIERYFRGMTLDPQTGVMSINMDPETPLDVQKVVENHAVRQMLFVDQSNGGFR